MHYWRHLFISERGNIVKALLPSVSLTPNIVKNHKWPAPGEKMDTRNECVYYCNICNYDTMQRCRCMRWGGCQPLRCVITRDSVILFRERSHLRRRVGLETQCSQLPVYTISLMFPLLVTSDMISCLLSASEDGPSANQRPGLLSEGQSEASWGEGCVVTQSVSLCRSPLC